MRKMRVANFLHLKKTDFVRGILIWQKFWSHDPKFCVGNEQINFWVLQKLVWLFAAAKYTQKMA